MGSSAPSKLIISPCVPILWYLSVGYGPEHQKLRPPWALLSPHNLCIDYLYLFFIAKFISHFAKRIVDWFEMAKVQCWWAKAKLVCSPKFGEVGEKVKNGPSALHLCRSFMDK
jgi:hypothetical protein